MNSVFIPSTILDEKCFVVRQEGIKLAAPFNASPTTWSPDDLGKNGVVDY